MAQPRTLSESEQEKALSYAATTKAGVRNCAILLLTHLAGMRIGEVTSVRYCDILSSDNLVRVIVQS